MYIFIWFVVNELDSNVSNDDDDDDDDDDKIIKAHRVRTLSAIKLTYVRNVCNLN
jgi:hypothetical protein